MKALKNLLKCLFWLLIIALLVAPLYLIYRISNEEMAAYVAPETPELRETAYGEVRAASRTDVLEYVAVSGEFVSTSFADMELDYRNPELTRWSIKVGDEITEGQVIGTVKGEDVVSTVTGIVQEYNTYTGNAYLRVQLLTPLVLQCDLPEKSLNTLKLSDSLTLEDGTAVAMTSCSMTRNSDGTTRVQFTIDSDRYIYGQRVKDLAIYTGTVYPQALVLPVKCVYQKETGEDQPWFARRVTADGYYISESEVKLGYSNGNVVCVSGVSEGDFFDSGYKAIVEGN